MTETVEQKKEEGVELIEMEPGIYKGISNQDYFRINAVNNSRLGRLRHCPAAVKTPDKTTGPMLFGLALHVLALEGEEEYKKRVTVVDATTRNTKVYKETVKEHEESKDKGVREKFIILKEEENCIYAAHDSLIAHPAAHGLLTRKDIETELTVVWEDDRTGLLCKGRLDLLGDRWMADLKTTSEMEYFVNKCVNFGYFRQAAFYLDGYQLAPAGRPIDNFLYVVVESDFPHKVDVFEVDAEAINYGRDDYRVLMKVEENCREWGTYPAYTNDGAPRVLHLPSWAASRSLHYGE